ncbi:tumor necrosis factor-inducible gene 6 protein-like isoform X2 [Heterodontus francisci]|uniref:tumor necrosis factor-inducible gene 6 protein-like isoform X2 n=1 Tax=Heterodontus francisci TaxID=7792 RepID=UPI00355B0634
MLYFTDFQLEDSPDCSHDYVSIYDGPSILSDELGLICTGSSHEYTSTSNKMIINFISDSNGTGHGFTAFFYSQLDDSSSSLSSDEATECAGFSDHGFLNDHHLD